MPTIFSHAVFASAIGIAFRSPEWAPRFWILTCFCAVLPDFDVIAFVFGIRYESMLGHRGITHSIMFAILVGLIASTLFFSDHRVPRWKLALYFATVTFSHPLLDMLTDGGLGVALLAPFSNERFFFPWRPVQVSPIGIDFFSGRGRTVLISEFLWIWIPAFLTAGACSLARRRS